MPASFSLRAVMAGVVSALIGFASSFAVLIQGLKAVGAGPGEAASGLTILLLAIGVCALILSARLTMPVNIAWSTPGVALLATVGPPVGGFPSAVGAFILSGLLIVLSGFWQPLGRLVNAIPPALANAMLAGVLLSLCLSPVRAVESAPALGLPIIAVWLAAGRFSKLYAVPAAVAVAALLVIHESKLPSLTLSDILPRPALVIPSFSVAAMMSIGLPLFIVTMAAANIPGLAVLNANGYRPSPPLLFRWTGLFSLGAAVFGGHAVNLATITAALCTGENADPDPTRRHWATIAAGGTYVLLGLGATLMTSVILAAPSVITDTIVGLALFGALGASMSAAVSNPADREAAVIAFLVTASGVTLYGISSAFWGLLAGGGALFLGRRRTRERR